MAYAILAPVDISSYVLALVATDSGGEVLKQLIGLKDGEGATVGVRSLDLTVKSVSDGNMNNVWQVTNQASLTGCSVILKQALPFIRVCPDIPSPINRIHVEALIGDAERAINPAAAPQTLYEDAAMGVLISEFLEEYVALRSDLVVCNKHDQLGEWLGGHLARRYFSSSSYCLSKPKPIAAAMDYLAASGNNAILRAQTTDVWFQAPWQHEHAAYPNKITDHAEVIAAVSLLRLNKTVRAAVEMASSRFNTVHQSLLHGDFHSGSIMVRGGCSEPTPTGPCSIKLIDGEFGMLGPIGFDLGTILANLYSALFSSAARIRQQDALIRKGGYAKYSAERTRERWVAGCIWLTQTIQQLWDSFFAVAADQLTGLTAGTIKAELIAIAQDAHVYLGCELMRRTVGVAQIADFTKLPLPERGIAELQCLALVKHLLSSISGEAAIANAPTDAVQDLLEELSVRATMLMYTANALTTIAEPSAELLMSAATLTVIAKLPVAVEGQPIPQVKTRLASGVASLKGQEGAQKVAAALLADTIARMTCACCDAVSKMEHVLVVAPGVPAICDAASTWIASGGGAREYGFPALPSTELHWVVEGAATEQNGTGASLSHVLEGACRNACKLRWGPVLFVGADCPHLPAAEIRRAVDLATRGFAYIVPAVDGGYALLAIPPQATAVRAEDRSMQAFHNVAWSTSHTLASQAAAVQNAGIPIIIGKEAFRDIDEAEDWKWLSTHAPGLRIDDIPFQIACPRTMSVLQEFPVE
jgi:5-methylthioribose kinase